MLTIHLHHKRQRITTGDGSVMRVCPALVSVNGRIQYLEDCSEIENVRKIQIKLKRFLRKPFTLALSPALERGIAEFLNHYHIQADLFFDCYAFANLVHGVKPHPCSHSHQYWRMSCGVSDLQTGDTIFVVKRDEDGLRFCHAALYVGRGLYVSVYGAWGCLTFSSLKDMKGEFGGTHILRAKPRILRAPALNAS